MTDLIQRLRDFALQSGHYGAWAGGVLADQAADEIERLTAERDALKADAERYRYLRNRSPYEVFHNTGDKAGCWIDCEPDDKGLVLLTGGDADAAIDAARSKT